MGRPSGWASRVTRTVAGLVLGATLIWLAVAVGPARGAPLGWTVTASPLTLVEGQATDVILTVTPGTQQIGCLVVTVPAGFSVSGASVTSVPAGAVWQIDLSGAGPTTVSFYTSKGGWRLAPGDVGRFTIRVTPLVAPLAAWSVAGYQQGLPPKGSVGLPLLPLQPFVIVPAPTPTPVVTAAPTPTSAPTAPVTAPPTAEPTPTGGATATPSGSPPPSSDVPTPSAPAPPSGMGGGGGGVVGPGGPGASPGAPIPTGLDVGVLPDQGRVEVTDVGLAGGLGTYAWAVPGLFLGLPGLLILLIVGAQLLLAGIFVPVVRRQIGRGDTSRSS